MKRLSKQSLEYLHIIYVIWLMADYFSRMFFIDVGDDPTKIPVQIREEEGKTILRFTIRRVKGEQLIYTVFHMADIMQEYLKFTIGLHNPYIEPLKCGENNDTIVEPLFIDQVVAFEDYFWVDVIVIDNPIALKYMEENRGLFWKGL